MSGERAIGLVALLADAVKHGSRAIERVQIETAGRSFALVEAIPPLNAPAQVVHAIHDASVASTHAAIRLVSRLLGAAVARGLAPLAVAVRPRDVDHGQERQEARVL